MANEFKPLSEKEEKKLLDFWNTEITRGEKVLKYWAPQWRADRRAYENYFYTQKPDGNNEVVERPLFFSNCQTALANFVAQDPVPVVRPPHKERVIDGIMVENMLKYDFKRLKIRKKIRRFVLDLLIYNFAVLKTGYNATETFNYDANAPFTARISPFNYICDPEGVEQEDCRWEGEIRISDSASLREEDGYFNLDAARKLASFQVSNLEMSEGETNEKAGKGTPTDVNDTDKWAGEFPTIEPSQTKKVKIYEIYDKVNKKILEIVEGQVIVAYRDFPKYIKGSPYTVAHFNLTPDFFHGRPDFQIHESQYSEMNRLENRMVEFTRAAIPKYLAATGAFKKGTKDIEKIERGEMCAVIPVDATLPLDQVFKQISLGSLAPENAQLISLIKNETDQDTGIADFMRGVSPGKGTATQASMAAAGAGSRAAARMQLIDEATEDVAKKMFYVRKETAQMREWISMEADYAMINPETEQIYKTRMYGFFLTPETLQADFVIGIEAGSMAANAMFQKQQAKLNRYALLKDNPLIDLDALTRDILRFDGEDPDKYMRPSNPLAVVPPGGVNPMGAPGVNQAGINPAALPGLNQTEGDVNKNLLDQAASAGNSNVF